VASILVSNLAPFVPAGAILVVLKVLGMPPLAQVVVACGILGVYYFYVLQRDPVLRGLLNRIGFLRELAGWTGWSKIPRPRRGHRS
jgi:hypothetical protein